MTGVFVRYSNNYLRRVSLARLTWDGTNTEHTVTEPPADVPHIAEQVIRSYGCNETF